MKVLNKRFLLASKNYIIKVCDKDGVRVVDI